MRRRELQARLFDIDRACGLVERFVEGRSFDDYAADPLLRSAVERQLEIVGEALREALGAEPGLSSRITDASRIVALRNRLIHGHATVSDAVMWGIVETRLAGLRKEVGAILAEEEEGGAGG